MDSVAEVPTTAGRRYLQQLCKHWAHKFPVEFTPEHGEIDLPFGACLLDADDGCLRIRLEPNAGADPHRFEAVVGEHLQRFALREQIEIAWRHAPSGGSAP